MLIGTVVLKLLLLDVAVVNVVASPIQPTNHERQFPLYNILPIEG